MALRIRGAIAFALLAVGESFSPTSFGAWVQKEHDVPPHNPQTSSWARLSRTDADKPVTLTVALRIDEDRREHLERVLNEVSNPDHNRYGEHLTQDQITELLAVPEQRVVETTGYFQAAGAHKVEIAPNRDMLTVTMPVVSAEAALNTHLHDFQHTEHTKVQIVRSGVPYFLPAKIADHVSMVGELVQFPKLAPKKLIGEGSPAKWQNSCDASGCNNLVTPSVIAKRYKLPDQTLPEPHRADTANSMAVAEFQGQFWNKADLDGFGKSCHRDVTVAKTIGDEEPQGGIESELDIEYIKAVAPEIPLTVIYNSQYSLLSWANQINSLSDPPLVHSVSYGNDEKQQTSTQYMLTCNTAFMKAGARGLSILFASGDQGVCGREGCGFLKKHFNPDFPAASPYITAVGGTDFEGDDIGPEKAWNDGGGGFSDTFAIPSWQADAVAAYKSNPDAKLPPQSMWNNTGRGYPDVAALGGLKNPYCVNVGGQFQGVAGTSASCPVVAGVFAKLNGLRLSKGKSPLGWLNPFIYKNPSGFQDVQSGRNDDGGSNGFTAVKGWDAATGFGTPDFQALSGLVMAEKREPKPQPSPLASYGHWVKQEPQVLTHNASTSSWARLRRADADKLVTLTVALRLDEDRRTELERVLNEVSDPEHPRYGKHLSQDQVTELLAVPPVRITDTTGYFQAAGAKTIEVAPNRDMITVTMPVRSAETALNTELHEFQHSEHTKVQIVRASAPYHLPSRIAEHVMMVGELLQFPRLVSKKLLGAGAPAKWANSCDASACNNLVTPSVIAKRYKLPDQTLPDPHKAEGSNSMAVAEFQGQFWKKSDLDAFGKSCHRDVSVAKTIGDEEPRGGIESELDIEYIKAVAPEIPLTVIYNSQYSLLSWANQINSMLDAPLVHSVSYGNDEKQQTSTEYMYTCNTAFMKAGTRGMSILFASGDQGVCGREGCGLFRKHFNPDFPAASPYITAVGGTDFVGDDIGPEQAWQSGGGGFSDTFGIPAWQADAVKAYKSNPDAKLPAQSMWNNTGRGYPDVAALGGQKNPYCINVGGSFEGVAGTSASCPVVAGVFAKLNGLRLAKGRSPLGWLNPFIYKNPSGFQDVTEGRNDEGTSNGFTATKGWDAATGWGTPDFQALSGLVMGAQEEMTVVV